MPLAIAFAISAALHAAAIAMPGWDLPGQPEPPPSSLETRLLPALHPVSGAATKPKPPRSRSPVKPAAAPVMAGAAQTETAASEGEPSGGAANASEAVQEAPAAAVPEPVAAKAAEAQPPAPPWPSEGRVHYAVTYGKNGFVIGEMIHEWRIEDGRYTIRSVAEPKGLAALRGRKRTQTSAGDLTAGGLRPREFRDQKEGREPETAVFDWPAARVAFSGNRNGSILPDGTQDLLSMFYQLAWQAPRQSVAVDVATASRLGRWTFEWMGEESVQLAETDVPTLHLRSRADGDTIEVWLAPAYGGLPVRIRYVDRGGDVFEQTADSLGLN